MKKYSFSDEQKTTLESLCIPFAVYQYVDKRVVTVLLSDGFCNAFGYKDRDSAVYDMDHDMYSRVHPQDVAAVENEAVRFATAGGKYDVTYRSKTNNRSDYVTIHAIGEHVTADDVTRLAYVWYTLIDDNSSGKHTVDADISAQKAVIESRYDFLTGLPNMTYFFELTEAARDRALLEGEKPALLFMDFSGFKYFNHKYGFSEGDKYLQSFAKVLSRIFGSYNCCHIGQDRFALFCNEEGLEAKLEALFRNAKELKGGESLHLRVGIYHDTDSSTVPVSAACDRAKIACDSLKGKYDSSYCFYSDDQRDRIIRTQYILENFQKALTEKQIVVYYQPIIRSMSGMVCDEEALSRWNDPVKGMLSPAEFIPALEEARLIYKLDLYVLETVLEKIKKQSEAGLIIVPHSINLSRSDFECCDIVEEIRRRVDASGIDRELITIEITESIIASDFDYMKEQIERFRSLGFKVWMDDFGSAYSSLDILQSVRFDLIKFDMNFMKKLDEGDSGKIILTELMKMAASLGLDTVCEGVETEKQAKFLTEIGCSKLQGYYYCKPIPYEAIVERYSKGIQIGYENPEESEYYRTIGGINLYDLSVIASDDENTLLNSFNTLPMGVIEIKGDTARFVRSNKSYRKFIKTYFGFDLSVEGSKFEKFTDSFMKNVVNTCCALGVKSVFDETMPNGSVVHSFARRIAVNPVTGITAVAAAVLSITNANDGATYAVIARALAADYYNIYYVDLVSEKFIEYSSTVGSEEIAMERHGENFFEECRIAAGYRIYEEDRKQFYEVFSKENVIRELDEQGVFNTRYRLTDTGTPMYVNMKITRMPSDKTHIIMGISIIDAQMKHDQLVEEMHKERDALARVMALNEDYLSLYVINPDSGKYLEYSATEEYESLGFEKEGDDFFAKGITDGKRTVHKDDLIYYIENFTKEKVLEKINEDGVYILHYRLVINDAPKRVTLRIAKINEDGTDKLVAGVRTWKERR